MKKIIMIISFMLCILLFITEILFMTFFNISHGITREEIINIIETIDIKEELNELDTYKQVQEEIKPEILEQLVLSQEVEQYIKQNAEAIYINTIYNENNSYISSVELKKQIDNKINILIEEQQITPEQRDQIIKIIEEITSNIDEQIENINNKNEILKIISVILNSKTANYILIGIISIALIIFWINKSKEGYIWTGIPTLVTGILFLILVLEIEGKLPNISIDIETRNTLKKYLPSMINALKKSSIIMTLIGTVECSLYAILKIQERSELDGNN